MKRKFTKIVILTLGLVALLLQSCQQNIQHTTVHADAVIKHVYTFEWNNHSYIMFGTSYTEMVSVSGVVHNPDCKCFNKDETRD